MPKVEATPTGFVVKPTAEETAKEQAKQRLQTALANPKTAPTIKDVYDLLLDIARKL